MRKFFLLAATSMLLLIPILIQGKDSQAASPNRVNEIRELRQEVISINLIQGLYLTSDQAGELLPLARQGAGLVEARERRVEARQDEAVEVLRQMRQELLADGKITADTRKRHDQIKQEFDTAQVSDLEKIKELTGQTRSVLTENQLELVARFKPCLVVPDDSREPRTGQAGGGHLEMVLEKARGLSDDEYPVRKEQFKARIRPRVVLHYGAEGADARLAEIERVVDQARAMSDEEFALRKSELAASIKPETEIRHGKELDQAIAHHLLSPGAVPALERIASGK